VRGDYFAHYLMQTRDFMPVVRALQLHPTPAANLLAGRLSAFYGTRAEIRTNVLGGVIPGLPALTSLIMKPADSKPPDSMFESTIEGRLGALMRLCQEHGARLVFVVPATTRETYGDRIHTVAARFGLAVVDAPDRGEFVASDFEEGFHLNPVAARRYSTWFAPVLRRELDALPRAQSSVGYQQIPR